MNVLCAIVHGICMIYPLKHRNYVCLSIFVVHYGLNKIKLAFDAQYKIVILTYLLTYLALALKMLSSNPSLICSAQR